MKEELSIVYNKNTIEFVTVAIQFCSFLEEANQIDKKEFIDKIIKIIPLLYLKASLLPEEKRWIEEEPETFVTEYDYEYIRMNLTGILGADDDYLEVFTPDMAYSENPINMSISEDLADIYQDIKNFISVYEIGFEETMQASLLICKENFKTFWGQKMVNVLRPLHTLKYRDNPEEE
ncbi:MAG: DUF5063 domain-containing protein [Candidatus Azobacteroides sp.]|nr:DUF5063 domain-containing protein [Candidatus Azobacteroides sp.]